MNLLNYFPYERFIQPRKEQIDILTKISESNKKFIIIQAPVATGKSAIAATLLNAYDSGYVITPRKLLQDQYAEDFPEFTVLKGKSGYQCKVNTQYSCEQCGLIPHRKKDLARYINAELNNIDISVNIPQGCCPYYKNLRIVKDHHSTICNFHSLWFNLISKENAILNNRKLLIIDESHELEGLIRDITTFSVETYNIPDDEKISQFNSSEWIKFLIPEVKLTAGERFEGIIQGAITPEDDESTLCFNEKLGDFDPNKKEEFIKHKIKQLEIIDNMSDFIVDFVKLDLSKKLVKFVKLNIDQETHALFDIFEKIILMSGTIFDGENFAKNLGIPLDQVDFISVDSPIPSQVRPVICRKSLMVNTSFAHWKNNFDELINNINTILNLDKLKNVKGLIHTSSYAMSKELNTALKKDHGKRIITHNSDDFLKKFNKFTLSKNNEIFISPVCGQGVDLKDDLAKFQLIVRIPYPSKDSKFFEYKYNHDNEWINLYTLINFGQQLGRINRHENDAAVTFLLDSRFTWFINRNRKYLPDYVLNSIQFRN